MMAGCYEIDLEGRIKKKADFKNYCIHTMCVVIFICMCFERWR